MHRDLVTLPSKALALDLTFQNHYLFRTHRSMTRRDAPETARQFGGRTKPRTHTHKFGHAPILTEIK